jgi:recombinational DNA repair ATPase RecF
MLTKLILKGHPTVADAVINFEKGFNLLTAPNGRGKSTVLEMVSYCLFGTAALRGNLEEFPTLDCQLLFKVKDRPLRVVRSKKETMLYEGNAPTASSTTAVNAAILRLLGYGMKVYNVANHIKQGQVNALTDRLRPEDRRQVLENTVGLTVIDKVISELNKVSLEAQADLKANTLLHVQPVAPQIPVGFLSLADRVEVLGSLQGLVLGYRNAKAKIVTLVEPVKPNGVVLMAADLDKLREDVKWWLAKKAEVGQKVAQQKRLTQERDSFKLTAPVRPNTLPREALLAMADIDRQISLLDRERGLLDKPRLTREEIDNDRWCSQVYKLVKRFNEVSAHLVTCPVCEHEFVPNAEGELASISKALALLVKPEDLTSVLANDIVENGKYSEASLIVEEMRLPNLARIAEIETELLRLYKVFADDYKLQLERLDKFERDVTAYENQSKRITDLNQQFEDLGSTEFDFTYCGQLEATLKHQESLVAAHAAYEANLVHFKESLAKNAISEAHVAKLEGCEENLREAEVKIKASEHYDYQLKAYELESAKYAKRAELIEDLELTIADHKLAINGLKETKKRIKSFLLPSLNKAASSLVSVMTNGVIRSIQMLDDFSVKADGKRVDLFSGSEQAVINIALRIALGQVLTHKVFSVVIGDELDASMDVNRTGLLWQSLNNLIKSNSIEQLILVSHEEEPIEVEGLKRVLFTQL